VASTLRASATTWNVLGQQVLMGQLYPPQVPNPDNDSLLNQVNILQRTGQDLSERGLIPGPGLPFFLDAWDGYPKARMRLFDVFEEVGNVVVLSGDSHNTWAFELVRDDKLADYYQTGEGVVAVEFGTGSVSSEGFESVFTDDASREGLRQLILNEDPQLKDADLTQRGYGVLTLTPTEATNRFFFVPDVSTSNSIEVEGPVFRVAAGTAALVAE
jgi:alkaline phosphatase D